MLNQKKLTLKKDDNNKAHSQLNKYLLISYLICILEETNPENAQKESKTGFSFKYVCQK